jgi:hypothetical protein
MGAFVKILHISLLALAAVAFAPAVPVSAQSADLLQLGKIVGTVVDINNDTVSGATVVLEGPVPGDRCSVVTNDNGYYELPDIRPRTPYLVVISAEGFADWKSPVILLEPGQYKILADSKLQIKPVETTINVGYSSEEIATQQLQAEMKQRIFGIIPDFYTVYEPNAEPLTPKLKFRLAFKVVTDPVTAVGVALLSGAQQAGDTPNYGQGAQGFGKRLGANAADGFTDIMIGGAILPSLLHQDPRYFYQGTGTKKSRILHALSSPFVCKGDDGTLQPNYSSMGGVLVASALSNAYYPDSNRGAGLVLENFAISSAARMAAALLKEFVLRRFTHNVNHAQ